NTIVADSTAGGNCAGTTPASITDLGGNLSYPSTDSTCPPGFTVADPVLGPLQDNGGPTETIALGPTSAAIDAGVSDGCPVRDQRGESRPQGGGCDIGAFEASGSSGPTTTTTTTTTTTIPPTTTTVPEPGGLLTIDGDAVSDGANANVTGTIACEAGLRYRIAIELSQAAATGSGMVAGKCTGSEQSFRARIHASTSAGFQDGTARVDATASVGQPGTRSFRTLSTTESVEIRIVTVPAS
ncbi:MAG TPA: choice-of-anchor Q domain-containing protein, partial [Acidimicrobiales bacterium]|nr:choice-of-anchor Q domain-containing protein [Acidimicrobiales bacterium]